MIGIGITTRNRPNILYACLAHFMAFLPKDAMFVIIDDASDDWYKNQAIVDRVNNDYENNCKVIYKYNKERLGISGSKNACLSTLKHCEHIFLFDDDCFPRCPGWESNWITAGFDHLAYSVDTSSRGNHLKPTGKKKNTILEFSGVLGCMLYLSQNALKKVGWFDPKFGLYGYEHAQYTKRCHLAGLSPFLYSVPDFAKQTIYSLDMDYGWFGEKTPIEIELDYTKFGSSVTKAEADLHHKYAHLMNTNEIYIPEVAL